MKISVQTGGLQQKYGIEKAYQMIAEAGFDSVDANINDIVPGDALRSKQPLEIFDQPEAQMLEAFRPFKDSALKYGVRNYQAHALFPSLVAEAEDPYNDYLIEVLKKNIAVCDYIDCRNLVVHPFFLGYEKDLGDQKEWDLNIDHYSRLIPQAKRYHVHILLENMFSSRNGKVYSGCCSDFEEANRYIDTLNEIAGEEIFGFCFDVGHALLLGKDIKRSLLTMGSRIKAFHVHDNNGSQDQHYAPFFGIMDWNRFSEALGAIHFIGDLSFETFNSFNKIDEELHPETLRWICLCGHHFAHKAGLE